jgi:hypothetical protein
MLIRLIKRWMGIHVCEEFTRWEVRNARYSRPANLLEDGPIACRKGTIEFTRKWQERQCTICGRIEQQDLRN